MEFDFLPKLPKSDLDDRSFDDLVQECLLRIPRYCPEWTHHNPSDPGITLVELFSWLTDQMLLRFNQVPRRNYVTFLELMGVRLQPPSPAKTPVTFYLSAGLSENYTIPMDTEVATLRTETEEAIVFSTDRPVTIGQPQLRHLLTADIAEMEPQLVRDRFAESWSLNPDGEWQGSALSCFNPQPQTGNCFYLVFEPEQPAGNVISVTFKGEAATPTGINPECPPRQWQAWNGVYWQPILLNEADDHTDGFSFARLTRQNGNPLQGADVVLHLPQHWPVTNFASYQGRWIRCVYETEQTTQWGYRCSPEIVGVSVQAIGATVDTTQSLQIHNEILGASDGTPGQTFQLQSAPILPRRDPEYLLVTAVGGIPQRWMEITDFADSGPEDLHYTIDALTGTLQFGPLIREPAQIKAQTQQRMAQSNANLVALAPEQQTLKRQYGKVPPKGAELRMATYRTGGGLKGNVQSGMIRILKTAVPYVANVINHQPAQNGTDAESLDAAVIRVPQMLRTRDRAVTQEDFETLALTAGQGAVARVLCLPADQTGTPGQVRLLLVPQVRTDAIERGEGLHPDVLSLTPQLQTQVSDYLDDRRLLGMAIRYDQPHYVGVTVQAEVALEPDYNNAEAQTEMRHQLQVALYRFLNPITGGPDGRGWPFGRPVYPSDIVTLFQPMPGVRHLGTVQLFELRRQESRWQRILPKEPVIDPGPLGVLCSWQNAQLRSSHAISLL